MTWKALITLTAMIAVVTLWIQAVHSFFDYVSRRRLQSRIAHEARQRELKAFWRAEQTRLWMARTGLPAQNWMGGQVPKSTLYEMELIDWMRLGEKGKRPTLPIRPFPEKPIYR